MSFIKYLMEQTIEKEIIKESQMPVDGIGIVSYENAAQHVKSMISDIVYRTQSPQPDWQQVKRLLNNDALHAYLEALIKSDQTSETTGETV